MHSCFPRQLLTLLSLASIFVDMIFTFPPNQITWLCSFSSLGFSKNSDLGLAFLVLLSFRNNDSIPLPPAGFQKVFWDTSINENVPLIASSFSACLPYSGYKDRQSWSVIWVKKYDSIKQILWLASLISSWRYSDFFLAGIRLLQTSKGFTKWYLALAGISWNPPIIPCFTPIQMYVTVWSWYSSHKDDIICTYIHIMLTTP